MSKLKINGGDQDMAPASTHLFKGFNLSSWALRHQSLVAYLMVVLMLAGIGSYLTLGRAEDPDFTFKVMVVRTLWPGATAQEVEAQVTEKIEKKIQEVPWMDMTRSYSKPGESLVFVTLKDYTPPKQVPDSWYQLRKKINDMRHTLPAGVLGPFPNDEFGDTFGNLWALTGDGYSLEELRRVADGIARELRAVPDVKKIDLLGVQDEKIYIETSHAKLAALGLDPQKLFEILQKQSSMTPAGFIETADDRINLRVEGDFKQIDTLRRISLKIGDKTVALGDIAKVYRGYADPAAPRFRFQGQDAIGLTVAMAQGGNVIQLGERLNGEMARITASLPRGIEIHTVSDQPAVVNKSIHEFVSSLAEAVIIVLVVSFLSLGFRTGLVVALSIPLVLAITFLFMKLFNIDLQRISLGALIIALGLLVDDAIIAVEMMVVKMEQGWDRFKAATYAYTSTAIPMLTGTLVTAAAFTPVGFAKSAAGEYTFAIFAVVTIALLASWVVAVVFTPWIGYRTLPARKLAERGQQHGDVYASPFYQRFRALLNWCLEHRWTVIGITVAAFVLSIVLFATGVQKQFFPASNRPELLVDLWLPQGASLKATEGQTRKLEKLLEGDPNIEYYVDYTGIGSPRFYLPLDQQLNNTNFAQFVIVTGGVEQREALRTRLIGLMDTEFSEVRGRVLRLENGPPVGFPVQFRISGDDLNQLRGYANQIADIMRQNPHVMNVHLDWNELSKSLHLDVDHDKARALGLTSQDLQNSLQYLLQGIPVTQFREADRLIDVVARAPQSERDLLSQLESLSIHTKDGRYVPLGQVAKVSTELEEGVIWRRNRRPTITVRADIRDNTQAPVVSSQIKPLLQPIEAKLPLGYLLQEGGAPEESAKGENSIKAVMPMMILGVITLLMVHLQSFSKTVLVMLTAPLGLIGVAIILLAFQVPYGFVANLGVIALFGMIIRNSVILVDQIDQDLHDGIPAWEAIVGSAVRRFRPIMLTALAAILAMIPLSRSIFWGPMAVAIMGGLFVATLLTLLFLPALYAAWFKVKREPSA